MANSTLTPDQYMKSLTPDQFMASQDTPVKEESKLDPNAPKGVEENIVEGLRTGYEDFGGAIQSILHPYDTIKGIAKESGEQFGKAKEAFSQGRYGDAFDSAGRAVPILGPMAGSVVDSANSGHYGAALARLGELGLPEAADRVPELPGRVSAGMQAAEGTKPSLGSRIAGHVAGYGIGEMAGHPYLGSYMGGQIAPRIGPFIKGFMGEEKPPLDLPVAPPKPLSLGQLQEGVKSGAINIDQFKQRVSQMGYSPEDIQVITSNLQPKTVSPLDLPNQSKVGSMTSISPGQMERAVLNGTKTLDDYKSLLVRKRMIPEDIDVMMDNLQKKIEESEAKEKETSAKEPKVDKKQDQEGTKRTLPNGQSQVLKRIDLDQIDPDPGNKINEDKIAEYQRSPSAEHPELRAGEGGRYIVQEGHHRLAAGERNGDTKPLVWIPDDQMKVLPPGHESFLAAGQPNRPELSDFDKEGLQSTDRAAKENRLAQHMISTGHDLGSTPTSELLKSMGKEAGLKWEPSLRTYENAVKKAKSFSVPEADWRQMKKTD